MPVHLYCRDIATYFFFAAFLTAFLVTFLTAFAAFLASFLADAFLVWAYFASFLAGSVLVAVLTTFFFTVAIKRSSIDPRFAEVSARPGSAPSGAIPQLQGLLKTNFRLNVLSGGRRP